MNRQERRLQQKLAARGAAPPSVDTLTPLLQRMSTAYRAGQHADALGLAREAIRRAPRRADVLGFAGMVALDEDQAEEAARHYRAALALRPDWAEAAHALGSALERMGDRDAAAAAYRKAAALAPDYAPACAALGNLMLQTGDAAAAADAYRRAVALAPDSAELRRNLGIALERAGDKAEAIACYRGAVRLRPEWPLPWTNLATLAVEDGDGALGLEACERWLRLSPGNTEAIAYQAISHYERGEPGKARELIDFDHFVRLIHVPPPPGFADAAAFNRALVDHVLAHPSLKVPPVDDPTYHCPTLMVSDELLAEPKGPMAALETAMNQAVADYIGALPAEGAHPFLARRPRQWRLTSWSAVLVGEGALSPHIHLDGYLSGVYYPQIPQEVLDSTAQEGWFELGRPPREFRCRAEPDTRAIRPELGLMLLFPAFMYHRTIPFRSSERRISIAFDVIPVE